MSIQIQTFGPVIIAEKACLVTGDLIVVVVTWWKTYITVQDVRKHKTSAPLAVFLFRDGQPYTYELWFLIA